MSVSPPLKQIRCLVACDRADGRPCLAPFVVEMSEFDIADGEHYAVARQHARDDGYWNINELTTVIDEEDGPPELFKLYFEGGIKCREMNLYYGSCDLPANHEGDHHYS